MRPTRSSGAVLCRNISGSAREPVVTSRNVNCNKSHRYIIQTPRISLPRHHKPLHLILSYFLPKRKILSTSMSDPNNPNIKSRTTPQWGLYQRESFWGTNDGKYPIFNTGKLLPIHFPVSFFLTSMVRSSRNGEIGQGEALTRRVVSQTQSQGAWERHD